MNNGIDLVVPWVDGSDPNWINQKSEYEKKSSFQEQILSRDWGLMRYWFRGVEKNLPWVRKIHFITWGHLPPWLNINHPKLHIVKHEDFDMSSINTVEHEESCVTETFAILQNYTEKDNCSYSTVASVVEELSKVNSIEADNQVEYEKQAAEIQTRIDELDDIISEIYDKLKYK